MTKGELLSEIRRHGHGKGGQVSFRAFCRETGIPEKQIVGKHWATWNDAISEAGLAPQSFLRPPTDENAVLEAVGQLVQRLGHWATENELSLERRRDGAFPSLGVLRTRNKAERLSRRLERYCAERPTSRSRRSSYPNVMSPSRPTRSRQEGPFTDTFT